MTRLSKLVSLAVAGSLMMLLAPNGAEGQDKIGTLGGHRFVTNRLTGDPFPVTSIRTSMGIGQALGVELVPDFELGDREIEAITGDLLYASLEFQVDWALQDWMSVFTEVSVLGRLGSDTGALLIEGVSLVSGFELGWLFRLVETETTMLSGTAQLWSDDFTVVNLTEWVEGIIDGEDVPLVRNAPVVRTGGGLRFAWATTDWLGVLLNTDLGYGESADRKPASDWYTALGAGLSIDLNPAWGIPLGFGLGYRYDSFPRSSGTPDQAASGGSLRIVYTGRDDFLLSLDNSAWGTSLKDGGDFTVGTTAFTMRYFF